MKKIIVLSLIIIFAACNNNIKDSEKTIEYADSVYDQFDLNGARSILNYLLLSDTVNNKQKCEALRRLAHQDWKYYKDFDVAKRRLTEADSIGESKFDTWMLLNRIEREAGNFENSLQASKQAENYASSVSKINKAKIGYAETIYALIGNLLEKNEPIDSYMLDEASKLLLKILESNAGMPTPSKLLLGISLLKNDGENVLRAWKSYFHIQDIKKTYPYMYNAAIKLSQVCRGWKGDTLKLKQQEKLLSALAASRMYEFIPMYIKVNQDESNYNPNIKDIIRYSEYLQNVKNQTDEYYRLIAIGDENEKQFKNWLRESNIQLWNDLSFLSTKPFSKKKFLKAIGKQFGAYGFDGSTANFKGLNLCLGHIVNRETAKVEQYGYKPEITYTQIDMMISNTFPSWFWENKASGGWATDDEIIRVREVYLKRPFNEWNSVTDSSARHEALEKNRNFINLDKNHDRLKVADGLERKLNFDASTELYINLYDNGFRGNELKLAFLSTFESYRMEATILAHEGRHSIDKRFFPDEYQSWDNEEREFRAKLSQIIFSKEPRYELAGMVNDIGEYGHGKANKRIVDVVVQWIKNNKEKVNGFSDVKTIFAQIYLLSAEQIKECFEQVDPLGIS